MINDIRYLSVEDNNERFDRLCSLLDKKGVTYKIKSIITDGRQTRNIIVRFGTGTPRLVMGAHHDSVADSTGANDNMSGVVILIKLAEQYIHEPPEKPIDIVFFDHEETGALGSRAYVDKYGEETLAMINLDICGVGDSIIVGPRHHARKGILSTAFSKLDCTKHNFHILKMLPPGDDRIFENEGIPNVSIGIIEARDVHPMSILFDLGKEVPKENYPSIIETMHNGPRDTVDCIENTSLEKVYLFTLDLIKLIQPS